MNIIVTEKLTNGQIIKAQSEDGRFQWFCGQEDFLRDTSVGRSIYQLRYMRLTEMGSDPVPEDVKTLALQFWEALEVEKSSAAQAARCTADELGQASVSTYRPEVVGAERARQERLYDDLQNEGAEGYNPWRNQ